MNTIETGDRKEFVSENFSDFFLKKQINKILPLYLKRPVFVKHFILSGRDKLEKSVSEKSNVEWSDEMIAVTKEDNNAEHSSTKLTPIQSPLELNKK